jgi:hypothetical protein
MVRRVLVPGSDNSAELTRVRQAIETVRADREAGLWPDIDAYRDRLTLLLARESELSAETVVPARVDLVPTGQTFSEAWSVAEAEDAAAGGWAARRVLLNHVGLRFVLLSADTTEAISGGEYWFAAAESTARRLAGRGRMPRIIRIDRVADPAFEVIE